MSLYISQLSFLTLRPSIKKTSESVVIRTGAMWALTTLFTSLHRVEIFPATRRIHIFNRRFYFLTRNYELSFENISHVDYSFKSFGTSWGWTSDGYGRHDQVETYSISLVTGDGEMHHVCSFRGEGAVHTGWAGVLLGDDSMFDVAGTQDQESRVFADSLAKLLGVTLGQPMKHYAETCGCSECGHDNAAHRETCLYCGAALKSEPDNS